MKLAIWIGAGGFIGTLARYGCGLAVQSMAGVPGLTTFLVNLIGSFAIGWVYGRSDGRLDLQAIQVLVIGVLGGFTTYSAFSNETFLFLREGRIAYGAIYAFLMFALCLLATAGGYKLAA